MPLTLSQRVVLAEAVRRYVVETPPTVPGTGFAGVVVDLLLMSTVEQRAAILPMVQAIANEYTATQAGLAAMRSAEDARVAALVADAAGALANL